MCLKGVRVRFPGPPFAWSRARLLPRPSPRLIVLLLLASGCEWHGSEYPTDPEGRSLVVHGMLAGGEPQQEILVEYTRGIGEGYFRGVTPATGAQVVVVGDETHRFGEDPARPGMYRADFSPRPGRRYTLQVRGPAGEVVTSETLVPGPPRLISPAADTAVSPGAFVTLQWSAAPASAAYVLTDRPPGRPSSFTALLYPYVVGDTSVRVQPGTFGRTSFHFRVAAVDANYLRYVRGTTADTAERNRVRSTVEGGYGLFGSYALSNTRVVSVR